MQNHYSSLLLAPTATQEEIRASWRRLALLHHPDKNPGVDTKTAFQAIQAAWETLGDEGRRAAYHVRWREELVDCQEEEEETDKGKRKERDDSGGEHGNEEQRRWEDIVAEMGWEDSEWLHEAGRRAQNSRRQGGSKQGSPNLQRTEPTAKESEQDQTKAGRSIPGTHRMGRSATFAQFQDGGAPGPSRVPAMPRSTTYFHFRRSNEAPESARPTATFPGQRAAAYADGGFDQQDGEDETTRAIQTFKARTAGEYLGRLSNYRSQHLLLVNRINVAAGEVNALAARPDPESGRLKPSGTFRGLLQLRRRYPAPGLEIQHKIEALNAEVLQLRQSLVEDRKQYDSEEHEARNRAADEALAYLLPLRLPRRQAIGVQRSREAWSILRAVRLPSSLSYTSKGSTDEMTRCECDTAHALSEKFTGFGTCGRCEKLVLGRGSQCARCRMMFCLRCVDAIRILKEYEGWLTRTVGARSHFDLEGL